MDVVLDKIGEGISSGVNLKDCLVNNVYKPFEGAQEFKDRHRSLELKIVNGTQHRLEFVEHFFCSGTFYTNPNPLHIDSGEGSFARAANRAGSIGCGLSGGITYKIAGTDYFFYVGFTNPHWGCYKTFIDVGKGKSAEWAYEQCNDDSVKQIDKQGFYARATMHEPHESPCKLFQYAIMHKK